MKTRKLILLFAIAAQAALIAVQADLIHRQNELLREHITRATIQGEQNTSLQLTNALYRQALDYLEELGVTRVRIGLGTIEAPTNSVLLTNMFFVRIKK